MLASRNFIDIKNSFHSSKSSIFWYAEGGEDYFPIENMGYIGTTSGHWRGSMLYRFLSFVIY
ncbi:hypothetical protein [Gillisia sp. JM1]|uniref:hypothetical protein n=1 Tax=Gillisia sp. JM1 TaxID=1283286 RepID=UPI0012DDFF82|nr:hypothetical protein [Gillisia sp. JM1]